MEISEELRSSIPPGNVQVPVDEFCEFWSRADRECLRLIGANRPGELAWESSYASGVLGTVRWLAAAQDRLGPEQAPFVPLSGTPAGRATRDSIGFMRDETTRMLVLFPDGFKTDSMPPRPGYLEGVQDAFEWACAGGPAPRLGVPR
ncbi:hypothetical protein [Kribbella sp. NPDC051620]|uniref:hypothetical protein n=1 Tax=Kribbella sp. NPDC051620 TaxID=3364120 RepID=UPI003787F5C5